MYRRTDQYELYEGTLQARGCFTIRRLSDDKTLPWNTGTEGFVEAQTITHPGFSDEKFNAYCAMRFDYYEQYHEHTEN